MLALTLVVAALAPPAAPAGPVPPHLVNYVNAPDPSSRWEQVGPPLVTPQVTVYQLKLTSQTWQGIAWDHDLQLVVPKGVAVSGTVLLWNQGGKAEVGATLLATHLAVRARSPVAFLYGNPKQPLYDGKREDALIAETFVKYLETGDASWPLLFPMVKSVTRAMDAVQAFAKDELKSEVTGFIVSGASKRGWTTWLAAATGDKRVKAIIPMVIDMLNLPEQMRNQVQAFGAPSKMIADYTRRGLIPIPDTERAEQLWKMVDPYTYRGQLTLPKLVILGTNDPYWPVDAVQSYYHDLPGEKYLLHVPNAGHDLREVSPAGVREGLPERAGNSIAAFTRMVRTGDKSPWRAGFGGPDDPTLRSEVHAVGDDEYVKLPNGPLTGVTQFVAESETRDFRKAEWRPLRREEIPGDPFAIRDRGYRVPRSAKRYTATYLEITKKSGDLTFTETTPVVVRGPKPE